MKKELTQEELEYRRSPDYIPTKEKIAYGLGSLMDGGGVALMSCIMLNYMTDGLLIVAATASTIMMLSKIWDAITDPVMGFISDNTRSKWGRRKPYMFFGGIALIIALFLLFAPIKEWNITSQAGMTAYVLIFYLIWNTCSTITQVPYTSMASDISPSFRERNNANTIKLVFSALASGLAYIVPLLVLGKYTKGEMSATTFCLVIGGVFGTLFGGGLIISALFTKERIQPLPTEEKQKFNIRHFFAGYTKPYSNKSYRWHIVMYVAAFTCMDMLSALAAYYATHVWRGEVITGIPIVGTMKFGSMFVVAPMMVAAVLAFPLVRIMMDKKGKAFAFRMGLPLYIIGGILIATMDPEWCPWFVIPIASFIMGFGFGGAQMVPWMNFPDTLDVAEIALGERPTGNYSGMMTLARKISGALGVGMIGWILSGVGYDRYLSVVNALKELLYNPETGNAAFEAIKAKDMAGAIADHAAALSNMVGFDVMTLNVDGVLLTIRLLMGIAVAVLISIALFGSLKFKLNNQILERMRYFSDKVKNGEYDTLTDAEKAERIDLIEKHYGKYNAAADAAMIAEMKAKSTTSDAEAVAIVDDATSDADAESVVVDDDATSDADAASDTVGEETKTQSTTSETDEAGE